MYDADAIEAINFEQLATVTDRLLLRGGRSSKRRARTDRLAQLLVPRGTLPARPAQLARGSMANIEVALDNPELTVVVRRTRRSYAGAALLVSGAIFAFAASVITFV